MLIYFRFARQSGNLLQYLYHLQRNRLLTMSVEVAKPPGHEECLAERSPYYQRRIELFESYFGEYQQELEKAQEKNEVIKVEYKGETVDAVKGVTTPRDIAGKKDGLVARVQIGDGEEQYWDLFRPFTDSCKLAVYDFEHKFGRHAFWHSSAHVLGASLELNFGVDLTIGPALDASSTGPGFYYDCYIGDRTLGDTEKDAIKKRMQEIVKGSHQFQRIEVSKEQALDMFKENKFKIELINSFPPEEAISVYRCGPMVDLCEGPHVPNTASLKAQDVLQMSRAYWRGDQARESLYRVYGITFPDSKQLKAWQARVEEAKKRDHRVIGVQQELFFFNERSAGSPFFTFHGMRIYNSLITLMRRMYKKYGYQEVCTPNIFQSDLWKTSGHWQNYKENMFVLEIEKQEWGLKPMNCPGHCELFGSRIRSYSELPMRVAEFGVLHRNEFSGALSGLTRVRRFVQDDGHIFCRHSQVMQEVLSSLRMLDEVYTIFGLQYNLALSTRPEKYLGEVSMWDAAEQELQNALNKFIEGTDRTWELDPGEGAFYGPKIDITVTDALDRRFQCATVQLDFQLPIKFNLEYQGEQERERPVIVHRAVLGSVERMFAILTEQFAGKWPLWVSPRQVMIVPISEASQPYALEVQATLKEEGFYVDVDVKDNKMQKKIREAQLAQYNYILVVGQQEQESQMVNVRTRANEVLGMQKLAYVIQCFKEEREKCSLSPVLQAAKGENGEEKQANGASEHGEDSGEAVSKLESQLKELRTAAKGLGVDLGELVKKVEGSG